jgi:hypothetical protein
MKLPSWRGMAVLMGILSVSLVAVTIVLPTRWRQASTWQQMSSPGQLSKAHAFLKKNCAACHTPNKGVEGVNCISCHANNATLLQRQPTAFHADITTCAPCHLEHQGELRPTQMDHEALAHIGLAQLEQVNAADPQSRRIRQQMSANRLLTDNAKITVLEATLNCVTCHATKDRHRGFFGNECASCHAVTQWTLPEFRHPSPNSQDCVQCHQAPPSHSMMHFKMVSAKVAKQPDAKVSQCYQCHQTTVWNDIRGVGWYKHH